MPYITKPSTTVGASFGRPTTLFVPNSYQSNKKYALIVLLHNYGDTGVGIRGRLDLNGAGSFDDGVIVFAPNGRITNVNRYFNYWTAPNGDLTSDFEFIPNSVAEIMSLWPIDPTRVYGWGYSNGAFMIHELVRRCPTLFTSTFTLAGCPLHADPITALSVPTPALHAHGDADATVVYGGDPGGNQLPGELGGHGHDGAVAAATIRAQWNGFAAPTFASSGPDFDFVTTGSPINECVRTKLVGCTTENAVEFWQLKSSGHTNSLPSGFAARYPFAWCEINRRTI